MQLLTVSQFARKQNISTNAVYQKIRRGTLKIVKVQVEEIRIPVEDTKSKSV